MKSKGISLQSSEEALAWLQEYLQKAEGYEIASCLMTLGLVGTQQTAFTDSLIAHCKSTGKHLGVHHLESTKDLNELPNWLSVGQRHLIHVENPELWNSNLLDLNPQPIRLEFKDESSVEAKIPFDLLADQLSTLRDLSSNEQLLNDAPFSSDEKWALAIGRDETSPFRAKRRYRHLVGNAVLGRVGAGPVFIVNPKTSQMLRIDEPHFSYFVEKGIGLEPKFRKTLETLLKS
jgi:hypothetical protein